MCKLVWPLFLVGQAHVQASVAIVPGVASARVLCPA